MSVIVASTPEVREVAPTITAAVRMWRTFDDLGAAFPELLPKVAARVAELGGAIAGPPYARYHLVVDGRIDVEIGAPIAAPIPGLSALAAVEPGAVGASSLPGGHVAVHTHVGPYATLADGWSRAETWITETARRTSGPAWEVYVDDPQLVEPEHLRTEIVFPLV
jgi:effector-binding domain-containing protein